MAIASDAPISVGLPLPAAFRRSDQAVRSGSRSNGGTGFPPPSRSLMNHTGL